MILWQQIHSDRHNYRSGEVAIAQSFTGNVLSVQVETKPEYDLSRQIIGWLYQYSGIAVKKFALISGNDVLFLALPETDRLEFIPTPYLNELYTLTINAANIEGSSNSGISGSIPDSILALPNRVLAVENGLTGATNLLSSLQTAVDAKSNLGHSHSISEINSLQSSLDNLSGSISSNANAIASLNTSVALKANSSIVSALDSRVATAEGNITANISSINSLNSTVSALQANSGSTFIPISTNQVLVSGQSYLASVSGLICTLPSAPSVGDIVNLATGNYTFRVNHGNSSQRILNLSTQSTIGSDNGIILKAYSAVQLMFIGSNLWVTNFRSRTTNNYVGSISTIANLNFVSNGDANGLFYYLGTNGLTTAFTNPQSSQVIGLLSSTLDAQRAVTNGTDRAISEIGSTNVANSWIGFDLGSKAVLINRYSLRSRNLASDRHLRNWVLEGTDTVSSSTVAGFNAATWTQIDSRANNNWATTINVWADFAPSVAPPAFRYIRLRQNGVNSGAGDNFLTLGEIELYGTLYASSPETVAV